jgi:tRNA threonylcarbamoyladenosine biosynthesis protein TsaB
MPAAAFETSSRSPTVALSAGGRSFEEALSGERPHASDLLPALARLLAKAGASVRHLELLVVGTGPGSFTGLRVAAATALGMARGGRAQLFGVPSLEALCWRELAQGERATVLLDARQGELYFAAYRRNVAGIDVLQAPCLLRPEEVRRTAEPGERWFCDSNSARFALDADASAKLCIDVVPSAAALLELGMTRFAREGGHAPAQIEPLYLRAFGARRSATQA